MGQQAQILARPRAGRRADRVAVPGAQATDRLAQAARYLGVLAALGMVAMLYFALIYAPTERTQGHAQRIFYPHYGSAIITYVAYITTCVASIGYLWKRRESWDQVARASAEVGVLLNTILLVAGSIWGKTIWGTWWTWDARLTTTLILWFIYVGYLMLRSYGGDTPQIARSAAVIGIIGCIDIPIINQSVNWWRTLHPAPVVQRADPALPAEMVHAMLVAMLAFFLLYLYLLIQRLRVAKLEASVGQARQRLLFADEQMGDGRDA
ncbi:MAG: cytochrome c biogenesis protein CcsA [Thermomicrobiales bacterium]